MSSSKRAPLSRSEYESLRYFWRMELNDMGWVQTSLLVENIISLNYHDGFHTIRYFDNKSQTI